MPLILPGNVASATAGGFEVANSCRFNDGDSAYVHKNLGTPTSTKITTFSWWMKITQAAPTTDMGIFSCRTDANNRNNIYLSTDSSTSGMTIYGRIGGSAVINLVTSQYFRDPAAWQHHVIAVDTSQGVAANRVKWYVNGTQITAFATETYPAQDQVFDWSVSGSNAKVGAYSTSSGAGAPFDGYIAEFCMIDGQQLAPTSFGEFNEDSPTIWQPIDVSELTFGNNGFYLDFEDSSNLGNDANGGTDLTEANLAAVDQTTDTPTNNFTTLNPLGFAGTTPTFSQGNLNANVGGSTTLYSISTIGVSSGKWYCEGLIVTASESGGATYIDVGYADRPNSDGASLYASAARALYLSSQEEKIEYRSGGSTSFVDTGWGTMEAGDFFQLYLDMDNELMYWGKDGSLIKSAGISFNGKESQTGEYFFTFGDEYTSGTHEYAVNFGQGSINGVAATTYTDAKGYGKFKYNPSVTTDEGAKDFLALCTKNLAEYG